MPVLNGRNYQLNELSSLWTPVLEARLLNMGSTAIILPIGMSSYGKSDATTFTSAGEIQAAFTWSAAPSGFTVPLDLTTSGSYQGIVPIVDFNGTTEEADTLHNTYFDLGDATNDVAFSVGIWVNLDANNTVQLLGKDSGAGGGPWQFGSTRLSFYDASEFATTRRDRDAAPSLSVWHHLVVTYSGVGGATASNGVIMYEDGAVAASTATNAAGYVAMEAPAVKVNAFFAPQIPQYLNGRVAGGPLGMFFVRAVLTADQVLRDYQLTRPYLGV